jgi:hypothetical protein
MPGTNTVPGITNKRNTMKKESNIPVYILIFVLLVSVGWLGSL